MRFLAKLTVFVAVIAFLFYGCAEKEPEKKISIHPSIVPIFVLKDSTDEVFGVANAVCVDKHLGFFITNSHVIATGNDRFLVKIHDRFYPVTDYRSEWFADISLVQINNIDNTDVLQEIQWDTVPVLLDEPVVGRGYVIKSINPQDNNVYPRDISFCFNEVSGVVTSTQSDYGITLTSKVKRLEVLVTLMRGIKVSKKKLHLLYEGYIKVSDKDELNSYDAGMSGALMMRGDSVAIGILSSANEFHALVVPAQEVLSLIDYARGDFTASQAAQ